MPSSILPLATELAAVATVPDVLTVVSVADPTWLAFTNQVGDPGNSIRTFSALPAHILVAGALQATLASGDSLTPMQATQVGLVWRTCRKVVHLWAGLPEEEFQDEDPWALPKKTSPPQAQGNPIVTPGPNLKDRVLKMASLVDQNDESELAPATKEQLDRWQNNYVALMGSPPPEEEEPSESQLAAINRKVNELNQSPYCDFGIWLPFARRTQRAQKFRTYMPLGDGTFLMKEIPGPQNFMQWTTSWRVYRTAAIMIGFCSLAALTAYEKCIEKLVTLWPQCWGLIAAAEDKARAERLERIRRKMIIDESNGKTMPADWNEAAPWTTCFKLLAQDDEFWNDQVRHPAAAWVAAGCKGSLIAPAEQVAMTHMAGGSEAMDVPKEDRDGRRRQSNRDKRQAKMKRLRDDRDELDKYRKLDNRAPPPSSKGKGKSKDQTGVQICYSFANGTGACGSLNPGAECAQKVKRAHKCQLCLSPGHRNADCPSKKG